MTARKLLPFALALLSGVLYFTGFVGFDQWYLAWICLVPLLVALRSATTWKRALLLSWLMGFTTHLGGYHWVVHLLQEFAHLPLPLAFLGYVLLCFAQGASLAAFGLLTWGLARRTPLSIPAAAPIALIATEFAFPLLFPSYLANSQVHFPLATQIADLGGVVLASGLVALVNAGVASLIFARLDRRPLPRALPLGAGAALAASLVYGAIRIDQIEAIDAAAPKLKTAIIQGNVGAGAKHINPAAGTRRYRDMTDAAMQIPDLGLVVWPESGYNRPVRNPESANLTGSVATEVKVPMILGALRAEPGDGRRYKIWNTALALEPGGRVAAWYDKIVLLAFGEYVPGYDLAPKLFDAILPYTSTFQRGTTVEPLPVGPYKLSTDICYEDILPGFIRSLMGPIDADGTRPHAMVNITNDSWYGPAEPPIHLALATFRSIEHRRWLIRSTATGISAFIDPAGRVVEKSGFETQETLVYDVPMITGGATVYGLLGDWAGWLALAASAIGLFWPNIRRKEQAAAPRKSARSAAA